MVELSRPTHRPAVRSSRHCPGKPYSEDATNLRDDPCAENSSVNALPLPSSSFARIVHAAPPLHAAIARRSWSASPGVNGGTTERG